MELWLEKWSYGQKNGVMVRKMELRLGKWSYGQKNGVTVRKMELRIEEWSDTYIILEMEPSHDMITT